jgi:hypothetical protein
MSRVGDESIKSGSRVQVGFFVPHQARIKVVLHDDAMQFGGKLFQIEVGAKMSLLDRETRGAHETKLECLKPQHEFVAHKAFAIVPLGGARQKDAAARQFLGAHPLDPIFVDRLNAWLPALNFESREKHRDTKVIGRGIEYVELQFFFGLEVTEQAALRHVQIRSESTNGETFQTKSARKSHGSRDDPLMGRLTLGCVFGKGTLAHEIK